VPQIILFGCITKFLIGLHIKSDVILTVELLVEAGPAVSAAVRSFCAPHATTNRLADRQNGLHTEVCA